VAGLRPIALKRGVFGTPSHGMVGAKTMISLANFDEGSPQQVINSPRSLQACKLEGVLPSELVFKPVESFQERNLEPRLVRLRFDFFEAKRRDLLAAARRARDTLVAEGKRSGDGNNHQLDLVREGGVASRDVLALHNVGCLSMEEEKLRNAHKKERDWLKSALNAELKQLQLLEKANTMSQEEGDQEADKQRELSRKMKGMNDERAMDEERKRMEAEARQKLEKQIAKEEFHRQQEQIKHKQLLEAHKAKEVYARQQREAELKREVEMEKERKREAEYQAVESRKSELRALDLRRMDILEQQKQSMQQAMSEKQARRDERIFNSIQVNMEMEQKRREDFEAKQIMEADREERLMQQRALQQEEGAKKAFQVMMRRKVIQEEAMKKAEERRLAILESQEETEYRLLEHEQKKERYLDFKRELDGLRGKNKEINVERQRRREESQRELVAEQVRKKDEKIRVVNIERKKLRDLRRQQQNEIYRCREAVKNEIMNQRVKSKFNSKALEKKLMDLLSMDTLEKSLSGSTSMPALRQAR